MSLHSQALHVFLLLAQAIFYFTNGIIGLFLQIVQGIVELFRFVHVIYHAGYCGNYQGT